MIQKFRRLKICIVGFGDIGERLVNALNNTQQFDFIAISRNTSVKKMDKASHQNLSYIAVDLDSFTQNKALNRKIGAIAGLSRYLLYLAPPKNEGSKDVRLQHYLQSYARHQAKTLQKKRFKHTPINPILRPISSTNRVRHFTFPSRTSQIVRSGSSVFCARRPTNRHHLSRPPHRNPRYSGSILAHNSDALYPTSPHKWGKSTYFLRHTQSTLVYISTTGVYGQARGNWVDETSPVLPLTPRAKRRAHAEKLIRQLNPQSTKTSILRVPGIYAAERLPVTRLQNRLPLLCDEDDVYTNHIHAEDLAHICKISLFKANNRRIYNCCDHSNLKMGEFFDCIADHLGFPRPPRLKKEQIRSYLSDTQLSFMNESRQIKNVRLTKELKIVLRYPTVSDFFEKFGKQ